MSSKKFLPYELRKDSSVTKAKKSGHDQKYSSTSGPSRMVFNKREVSPQFSQPEDYAFPGATPNCIPQRFYKTNHSNHSLSSTPWNESSTFVGSSNENVNTMPLYQPAPTFRQYLNSGNELQRNECTFTFSRNKQNTSTFSLEESIANKVSEQKSEASTNKNKNQKVLVGTRIRHMIGSVDQVIRWYKMAKNSDLELHYEVAGILDSTINKEEMQLLLIRSESGHVLQGVFYSIDRELLSLPSGSPVTAIGNMVGSNKIQIFDMNKISKDEFLAVQRLAFLSQRGLEEALL